MGLRLTFINCFGALIPCLGSLVISIAFLDNASAHSSNFKSYEECVISSLSGTNNTKAVEFIEKACAAKFAIELDALREEHKQELDDAIAELDAIREKHRKQMALIQEKHQKAILKQRERIAKLNGLIDALNLELKEAENWLDKLPTQSSSGKQNKTKVEEIPNLALSAGRLQKVKARLSECWFVPNIKFDERLSVDLRIFVDPSGAVLRAQVVNHDEYDANAEVRMIAKAALRAVRGCSPLPLGGEANAPVQKFIVSFKP